MGISGYTSRMSVAPGAQIGFHLSNDTPGQVTLTIQRVGATLVKSTVTANIVTQPVTSPKPWEGYGWAQNVTYTVPPTWPTGLYSLFDPNDGQSVDNPILRFVVLPANRGTSSRVLLRIAFLTEQAYNNTGGKSLYSFNSGQPANTDDDSYRATQVSLDRPGAIPANEIKLIQWLESEGIAVEYCTCIDLHGDATLLSSYECLVCAGHDEYWTKQMRDQAEIFVANGGNLIVLSGNTCYRQVRLEQNSRMLVFYKYAGNDPSGDNEYATVAFAEPPLNRPPNSFIGAGWTSGAFLGAGGTPTAYTIRFPNHWVFNGGPANRLQTNAFMLYETDAAPFAEEDEGYPRVTGEESTPLSYVVLASADLRTWGGNSGPGNRGKPGRATMGLFVRNGNVFHCGTTDWVSQLDAATGDPTIRQVTRNVFQRLRTKVPWDWEDIGSADLGTALTAVDNRLFIATSNNLLYRRYPVGADVPWREIGAADNVVAMAGSLETLFCVTSDNTLWSRPPIESNVAWTAVGTGPGPGTKALAGFAGMLYAIDPGGQMWRASASKTGVRNWEQLSWKTDSTINAMAAYADILVASTSDNRLLRSNLDWIGESYAWVQIHNCSYAIGLAVIDKILFVATSQNQLWRLDLHGVRKP